MNAASRRGRTLSLVYRVLAIAFVVAISLYIFAIRDQVETLTRYGYPGVFLFTLLTSATIILPAPSLVVVFTLGGVLNPLWVGAAAGAGATLGELSGYLAGFSGRVVIENTRNYDRLRGWMEAHTTLSGWLILLLAFIPLPIIDLAGMAAGALRMPVWQFQLWCLGGKLPKMVLVAWLGTQSIEWIQRLILL
jgi:membrane protein YqaA with SNARE-associated domain